MSDKNRRQDFRIDDILAMHDRIISLDEFEMQLMQPGIRSRQNAMLQDMVGKDIFAGDLRGSVNHDIANALEALDNKLNYLIGINMLNDANRSELKERPINLSITGASFWSTVPYKKGNYTSLNIMLPSFPPTILELLGEVTWVREQTKNHQHIGVQFVFRGTEEENSITKYVFRRQRENIRLKVKDMDKA